MNINLPQTISKKVELGGRAVNPTTNKSAAVILLIIIAGLFSWFMVKPKWEDYKIQSDQLTTLQAQQKALNGDIQQLGTLIEQLKSDTVSVSHLDQALPLNGKTIDLQLLLKKLAESSGVTIGDISFAGNNDEIVAGNISLLKDPFSIQRRLRKISGTINVSGTYDQLISFLNKLQDNGRIIDISSIEMGSAKQGTLDLKLSADTYYYE